MRLAKVEKGEGIKRLLFPFLSWKTGHRIPDVVRTVMYRPASFGRPFNVWIQRALRGPSAWTVWERELFAAFTSSANQCVF